MGGSEVGAGTRAGVPLWVVGLVLAAAVLRVIGLDSGLWFDEMAAALRSFRPSLREIVTTYDGDLHHPLYAILTHLSIGAFGESSWSMRLPALLFGVATIPAVYALGRCVAERREALVAAALLTVLYHHVWFSQNARGYSTLAFWAVLATYFLLRGIREERWGLVLAYGPAAALGVYTHLTMAFLVVGHAIVCLAAFVLARRAGGVASWRMPLAAIGLAGLCTLALYGPMLAEVVDFFRNTPSRLEDVSTPGWALMETIRGLRRGLGIGGLAGVLLAGILFGAGLWGYRRRSPFAFWLFTVPAGVTVAGALLARGTMYPRFFFFMVGFLVLILARGTLDVGSWVGERLARRGASTGRAIGTALAALIIVASLVSLRFNYRYPKQDYAGAISWVEEAANGDPIVTAGEGAWPFHGYYERPYVRIRSLEQLAVQRRAGRPVWMLYTFPRYLEESLPDVMASIREECPVERTFPGTIGDGDIIVCAFRPNEAG